MRLLVLEDTVSAGQASSAVSGPIAVDPVRPTVTDRALSKPSFSWSGGTFGYPDTDTPTEPRGARANASAQPTRQVLAQSRKKRQDLFRRV
jgi:hypothetical protein